MLYDMQQTHKRCYLMNVTTMRCRQPSTWHLSPFLFPNF